ncbi:hypothetical protein Tco_1217269 [Tanacetum coccineum]
MTSRPRTRVSVQAPFGGVTDWYPEPSIPVIPVVPAEVPTAPANLIVALEVGAVSVISPTEVLDLVDYSSSSDSDPSEDSLPIAPELPLVSPFLCTDDSKADSESEPAEQRPERHESLTPSFEFPLAPVVAPPGIRRRPHFTSDSSSSSLSSNSSSDISSGSSSNSYSDSSSVHSSGCDASGFMRWRSVPLSTLYPPTTSESSPDSSSERSLDSSSPSAGPSRKRCRFPTTLVPSSTPISRPISPALADLSPRKRFRDSYSSEVSREEHTEIGTADAETVAYLGISKGVGARTKDGIDLGVEVDISDIREDEEEFEAEASAGVTMEVTINPLDTGSISEPTGGDTPDLEGTLYDISHYMSKVPLDRITEFETTQRRLEASQLVASGERAGLDNRVRSLGRENLRVRRDRDDTRRRLRRNIGLGNDNDEGGNENGNGNGNGGGNGNRNHNENDRDARPVIRECTYQDFMKCQPLNFKGTEGVVGLIRIEIQKMEYKPWNLTVKNNDLAAYTQRFQELTMLCTKMVLEEEDRVEKFIGGLSDKILGNVIATEPTRLQDAAHIANNLIDQKLKGYAMKNAENKRKFDNSPESDHRGQQLKQKTIVESKN